MKNLFPPFAKLIAVAVCALTLGSCSRAEYAMLPKGGSYHGVTRVATPVPAAPVATVATPAPAAEAVAAPATAPEATVAAATPATKPVTKAPKQAAAATNLGTAATVAAAPAPKLSLLQRVALNKVTRKMDKLIQKSGAARQHDNTASTARGGISGNLRTGIILLLVGLLVSLFSGISGIFGIIGAIIAFIGLIFIILWLLDQA